MIHVWAQVLSDTHHVTEDESETLSAQKATPQDQVTDELLSCFMGGSFCTGKVNEITRYRLRQNTKH